MQHMPIHHQPQEDACALRQHYAKHFCSCGYRSASYDSIYCHQKSGASSTQDIHEVDKIAIHNSYDILGGERHQYLENAYPPWTVKEGKP